MSAYSTRAIYNPTGGRALWGGTDGRAIWAGPAWISPINTYVYNFSGLDSVTGDLAWTQTNYQQCQTDALTALRADTSTSYSSRSNYNAMVTASAGLYYGEDVNAKYYAGYLRFTLPTGKRGSITKVRVKATAWAGEFWDLDDYLVVRKWVNAAYNGFGCVLKLFFRDSAHPFSSGAAILDATPDAAFDMSAINDVHEAADVLLPSINNGNPDADYPSLILNCDAAAAAVNDLADDTCYLWSCITRSSFMPFLSADPESETIDYDFSCMANFTNPKLLVATE